MDGGDKFVRRAGDDGASIDVPFVCPFCRPDSGECHGGIVLVVEPDRGSATRFGLPPLVESAGGNQASALPEQLLKRRQPVYRLGTGVEQRTDASLRACIARSGHPPQRRSLALFSTDALPASLFAGRAHSRSSPQGQVPIYGDSKSKAS